MVFTKDETEVLEFLKKSQEEIGEATSKIAFSLGKNYYLVSKVLDDLLKKGFVGKINVNNSSYWKVKNGNKK